MTIGSPYVNNCFNTKILELSDPIWVTACSTEPSGSDSPCRIDLSKPKYEYKYIQDGDIIIGGVFSVNCEVYKIPDNKWKYIPLCVNPILDRYLEIQALILTVDELNKAPDLLPNVTLGYHVYDSCGDPNLAIGSVLQILSGPGEPVPNYSCRGEGEIAGFIGDRSSLTSLPIAQLLGTYGYPQISYGATDPVLNDRVQYPYYFTTGPKDYIQHVAIAELVERLGWTWVIILAASGDYGERETKSLRKEITKHGAYVDFIGTLTQDRNTDRETLERIQMSSAEVVILYGEQFQTNALSVLVEEMIKDKTLLVPVTWFPSYLESLFNGSLRFEEKIVEFGYTTKFTAHVLAIEDDVLLKDLLATVSYCLTQDEEKDKFFQRTLKSQCSANCPPGYRKLLRQRAPPCCYDCARCSEGEISNATDAENCLKCGDYEWPNQEKTQCIKKQNEFLSYRDDSLTVAFILLSLMFFLIAAVILGIFISYRDTPIVRANNRSLSFLLLVSIKLSFLSVFLFLGRPVDITCMLRIITFGITFSIAVSSLLAKTIMVCVAFKATKPGSSWRKWLGVKLSNSVVLFCSSIQIIICMTWLAISPPFQELDIHTSPGTIIIQCNEGSAIGFYSVIGYMGLLAAVSFVLAFLARSLPDSFNEAKYITFSMLLFCSVWITMIPAYLSTKGKNTVCVEIFAILTSSAGLLACIFLPKCYIILLKPEMNTKQYLLGNNKEANKD
uniref:G-protein coupled receptors family 3 profile domain-containing protein n=1 Tax=Xenopus tropicalis TaxID=8364 RepID=A0A1B8Y7C4_XENTR